MIRILMFDLLNSLACQHMELSGVHGALEVMSQFETADHELLDLSVVSAFSIVGRLGQSAPRIDSFNAGLELLETSGLRQFFEPIERRVTLAVQAGRQALDRHVFKLALERLETGAELKMCLFIGEEEAALGSILRSGVSVVRVRSQSAPSDALSWANVPLRVSKLVNDQSLENLQLALACYLTLEYELEDSRISDEKPHLVLGQANAWTAVSDPRLGDLDGIELQLPVLFRVHLDVRRMVKKVEIEPPDEDALREAVHGLLTMLANDSIDQGKGPPGRSFTHRLELDKQGRLRIVRMRFLNAGGM